MQDAQTRRRTARLPADPEGAAEAGRRLRAGGLVAFPTETVYGLGGRADDAAAVAGIYAAKGRPAFNPLIVHVADVAAARRLAVLSELAERLAARLWPGALTLVLPRREGSGLAEAATAGLATVALRVPAHPLARAALAAAGGPVAAPSANRSGRVSPTSAAHVLEELDGRIDAVLDGGPCPVGVESTILRVLEDDAAPVLLRPGGVTEDEIAAACGIAPLRPGAR
ncbi:MAG: L-threonylcarbamoyladenylate synthase, partial [Pseudomonadota bacterium]